MGIFKYVYEVCFPFIANISIFASKQSGAENLGGNYPSMFQSGGQCPPLLLCLIAATE